jgi:hypothetical protein
MTPFQKKRRFPSSPIRMIYMVFQLMLLDMPPIIMSDVEKAQFWRRSGNWATLCINYTMDPTAEAPCKAGWDDHRMIITKVEGFSGPKKRLLLVKVLLLVKGNKFEIVTFAWYVYDKNNAAFLKCRCASNFSRSSRLEFFYLHLWPTNPRKRGIECLENIKAPVLLLQIKQLRPKENHHLMLGCLGSW